MKLEFEKIIPSDEQIDDLFTLLKSRKYTISHSATPAKSKHIQFVSEHPYVVWYLIYKDKALLGSVYIQLDNSIGIDLLEYNNENVLEVINYIKDNHQPLPAIKSVRRSEFFVNVAPENAEFLLTLKNLDKGEIQRSFAI